MRHNDGRKPSPFTTPRSPHYGPHRLDEQRFLIGQATSRPVQRHRSSQGLKQVNGASINQVHAWTLHPHPSLPP